MPKYAIRVRSIVVATRYLEADSKEKALDAYQGDNGADLNDYEYDYEIVDEDEEFLSIKEIATGDDASQ